MKSGAEPTRLAICGRCAHSTTGRRGQTIVGSDDAQGPGTIQFNNADGREITHKPQQASRHGVRCAT